MMYRKREGNTLKSDSENWRKDTIKFGISVLQKYNDRIPNKLKARIHLNMAHAYSKLGNMTDSKKYLLTIYFKIFLNLFYRK